jgi:hypothetical protein
MLKNHRNNGNVLRFYPSFQEFVDGNNGILQPVKSFDDIIKYSQRTQQYKYLIEANGSPSHYIVIPVVRAHMGFKATKKPVKIEHQGRKVDTFEKQKQDIITIDSSNGLDNICYEAGIDSDNGHDHRLMPVYGNSRVVRNEGEISRMYIPNSSLTLCFYVMVSSLKNARAYANVQSASLKQAVEHIRQLQEKRDKPVKKRRIRNLFRKK